jgi:hypothetical protein
MVLGLVLYQPITQVVCKRSGRNSRSPCVKIVRNESDFTLEVTWDWLELSWRMTGCWGKVLRQLWLLVWKNFLFRRRQCVVTAFEVILPTLLAFVFAQLQTELRGRGSYVSSETDTTFPIVQEEVRHP